MKTAKSAGAFRTISEVADELDVAQHVLRFWESKFPQVRPLKRGGGRRYYRPEDVELLRRIRSLLYDEGYTIKGAQKLLKGQRRPPSSPASPQDQPVTAKAPVAQGRAATTDQGKVPKANAASGASAAAKTEPSAPPADMAPKIKHALEDVRDDLAELRDVLQKALG